MYYFPTKYRLNTKKKKKSHFKRLNFTNLCKITEVGNKKRQKKSKDTFKKF